MSATGDISQKIKALKVVVVIPTYNNAPKLLGVLQDVCSITTQVIVVNDGSTDNTQEILQAFPQDIHIIHLPNNKGKGNAMLEAFHVAQQKAYDYAISIDSDGQHLAKDIPLFLEKIDLEPGSMIVGARNMKDTQGVPSGSSFGHNFSNFWFWVETAKKLPDTQSGYRLYPLKEINKMRFFTPRYEFEIESLVRLSWAGVSITWVPIEVKYPADRISHFRKFWDFFRISILNTVLVLIALLWIKPRDLYRRIRKESLKEILLREVLHSEDSNKKLAQSIGFGFFMGIFPVWGFQMILTVALAIPFKLNKAVSLIAANISLPPIIPFIIYISFLTGALFMNGAALPEFSSQMSFEDIKEDLIQYYVGAVALSVFVGVVGGVGSYFLLKQWRKEN
ncbi:MAG: glycosyltransferase [Bacteroidetes bacterium 4572_77]|nr:MAG: glycosyltransferase [Bacteroidetes bacterium 4572_77]